MKSNIEHLHDDVFGKTFAMYDKEEMIRFIEPFKIRFERNKLDPHSLFKGKKCLDAGCGNGRGSIFMAMHGAAEIQSIDISLTNIESVKRNAEIFGYSDIINVCIQYTLPMRRQLCIRNSCSTFCTTIYNTIQLFFCLLQVSN